MTIKCILTDLGGVLVLNHGKEIYAKYNFEDKAVKELWKLMHNHPCYNEYELKKWTNETAIDFNAWRNFLTEFYASESRNEPLITILKSLKQKDVLLGYVTNNSFLLDEALTKHHLTDLPHFIVNSSQVGRLKSDPLYWDYAYEQVLLFRNILKSEIVVIDDCLEHCETAIKKGFAAKHFTNCTSKEVIQMLNEILKCVS